MGVHGCHRARYSKFHLFVFLLHNFQCDFDQVDFRIVYDDDVYGARIIAEGPSAEGDDEYNVVCNHLIGNIQSSNIWCNLQNILTVPQMFNNLIYVVYNNIQLNAFQ